jgi:uncharacterized membrane protein YdfJ with MMPL/SSD domain
VVPVVVSVVVVTGAAEVSGSPVVESAASLVVTGSDVVGMTVVGVALVVCSLVASAVEASPLVLVEAGSVVAPESPHPLRSARPRERKGRPETRFHRSVRMWQYRRSACRMRTSARVEPA